MTDSPVLFPEGSSSSTSLGLLDRARERDAAAWQRLRELYEPLICHWCRLAGLQPADMADVQQDVFTSVLKHLPRFQREATGGFRGWLRTITRSKIADLFRRNRVVARGALAQPDLLEVPAQAPVDPDAAGLSAERRLLYRRAMEIIEREFEERTWKTFWRVVIDGAAPADVARDFNTTVNAVYLAKSRVLARLHEEFVGIIDD